MIPHIRKAENKGVHFWYISTQAHTLERDVPCAVSLPAQIGQVLLHCLHFSLELAQISFQLGYLFSLRLIAALKLVTSVATTSTATTTSAVAFSTTTSLTFALPAHII